MTPETIATIREVLETEVETSGLAMAAARRYIALATAEIRHDSHKYWANIIASEQRQSDAESERHDRASAALDEFNAAYPIVALIVCGECNGEGRTRPPIDMVCSWCNGKGKVEDK